MNPDPFDHEASSSAHAGQLDMAFESIVRRKFSLDALTEDTSVTADDVRIKLACSSQEQAAADRFLAMRYAWRGYVTEGESQEQSSKRALFNFFTLLAYRENETVGTLTVGVDAGHGLVVDEANREMVDGLRRIGRRVVELRRLAVRDEIGAKVVLAHLFRAAYLVGRVLHDATDVLIEVNPRHASFYRRIFGFVGLGDEWICTRVNAPAVLLRLDIAKLDRKLNDSYGCGALQLTPSTRRRASYVGESQRA
jgi:N-acyl amino acid synthase FeeM